MNLRGKFDDELSEFPFTMVDVGALFGVCEEWQRLKFLKAVGFEPSEKGYEELKGSEDICYINSACYCEKKNLTLHVTELKGLSSIFMPNYDFLSHFPDENINGYKLQSKVAINADKLDNLLAQDIDFIKIDVEGAAFQVLKGAEKILKDNCILGLKVEAEFNEKYKGQNLFSDSDLLLRKYKYQLFDVDVCRWKRRIGTKTSGHGQLIHGDFIYFIDSDTFFEKISSLPAIERTAKIVKFIILCYLYKYPDLALEVLDKAFKKKLLNQERHDLIHNELLKTTNFFRRIPKLNDRNGLLGLMYHLYMAVFGVWNIKFGEETGQIP